MGKAWDAVFMLPRAIGWVGKQAELNASLVHLGEGWQLIPQAITKWCTEPKGTGCPDSIPFHLQHHHLTSAVRTSLWGQQGTQLLLYDGRCPGMTLGCPTRNEAKNYKKAKTKTRGIKNCAQPHPHHLCPHQIAGLRVTEVQHHLHQCHQGLIDLVIPGIHTTADNTTKSPKAIWKSTCQFSRMRTWKMLSPTKVGTGI